MTTGSKYLNVFHLSVDLCHTAYVILSMSLCYLHCNCICYNDYCGFLLAGNLKSGVLLVRDQSIASGCLL